MLLKNSLIYTLARGLPGIANFVALAVFTRLLSPDEYGVYALTVAAVTMVQTIGFQWLGLGILRFLPAHKSRVEFQSQIVFLFVVLAAVAIVWGGIGAYAVQSSGLAGIVLLAIVLLVVQAWFELCLATASADIQPITYGWLSAWRSLGFLVLGAILVLLDLGEKAPVLGLISGMFLANLFVGRSLWRNLHWAVPGRDELDSLVRYSLPLAMNFALAWVISSSDRFIVGWLLGSADTGLYAAGYDLAFQPITVVLFIINLTALPLAIRVLDTQGAEAASIQMSVNGRLFVGVALSAAVSIIFLASNIGETIVGVEFQETATSLIPWVAAAACLAGLKSYYFDTAFHLSKKTSSLVWISLLLAVVNALANFLLIPQFGVLGAAYATLLAYGIGLILSLIVGRRLFLMPRVFPMIMPAAGTAVCAGLAAWAGSFVSGWGGLIAGGIGSVAVAIAAGAMLGVIDLREIRQFGIRRD